MKKQIISILQLVLLCGIFCFFNVNFGQNKNISVNSKNTLPKSLKKEDVKLKVELAEKKVKVGEKIVLKVHITNNFLEKIIMPYCLCDNFNGYQVEINDSKDKVVQPFKNPYISNGFESFTVSELMPEKEQKFTLLLSYFYQLPIGEYSIKVTKTVSSSIKRERVLVESQTVILTILK